MSGGERLDHRVEEYLTRYPSPDERMVKFCTAIERQREAGVDEYAYAFDNDFADRMLDDERFRDTMFDLVAINPDLPVKQIVNRLPKVIQFLEWERDPDNFPYGYDKRGAWQPSFDAVVEDGEYRAKVFDYTVMFHVSANVSDRGKLSKAAAILNGKTVDVSFLDVGCSLNLVLKRLAQQDQDEYRYSPLRVYAKNKISRQLAQSALASAALNHLVQHAEFQLGDSYGCDIWDADRDPKYADYAFNNSFYMSEMVKPGAIERFRSLMATRPSNVHWVFGDITKPELITDEQVDVVLMSTVLYQIPKVAREAIAHAERHVKDDGLVMIQDFVDFKSGVRPKFYRKENRKWHYNLWVKDMTRPGEGYRKYFSALGGRVEEVVIHPVVARLPAAREYELDVVKGV